MPDAPPITILHVDDTEANRYIVSRVLRRAGFEVMEAATGEEALRLAARKPDLVILDINLPDINGREVCRRLKQNPDTASTMVLHVSANLVRTEDRVQGLECGADGYLTYPLEPSELVANVRALLRIRNAEAAVRESARAWEATFDAISDGVCLLDTDARIVRCNRALANLLGKPYRDVIGQPLPELARGFLGTQGLPDINSPSGRRETYEVDLGDRWLRVTIDPVRSDGTLSGVVCIFSDVTREKRTGEALREREQFFRLLVEGVKDYAIFTVDVGGHVTSWNVGAERILGYRDEEIIGEATSRFFTPEDLERGEDKKELQRAADDGRASDVRWHVRKDGSWFWAVGVTTALRDEAGCLRGFSKIMRDDTERKTLNEALEQRADELHRADRRKDEFLAMLGHELRNPLAPILNSVHVMRVRGTADPVLQRARDVIERQVQHMARLLEDLLDVSRITRGTIELRKERVDLGEVTKHALQTSLPLLEIHEHEVTASLPSEPLPVLADATRLEQVITNLLNNAAKFTGAGGTIALTAAREGNEAVVRVRDTGRGIPPEMLPHVFDLFTQVDPSIDRSQGGLGLGLTLVRSLIDMHGGTVSADSPGIGRGSEFTVRLPLWAEKEGAEMAGVQGAGSAEPGGDSGLRVLLVEDNPDARETLGDLLELWGYEVTTAGDGPGALTRLSEWTADVALVDIGLPGFDGYEVARQIRTRPGGEAIHLVALTGYGQPEDRQHALDAGFDAHLVKPVDPDKLSSYLKELRRAPGRA